MKLNFLFFLLLLLAIPQLSCVKEKASNKYQATKCVIVIIDGPRWSETGGDSAHLLQPYLYNQLKSEGCVFEAFYNKGVTNTTAGHTAILTGNYQDIANNGTELPQYPGLLQLFKEKYPDMRTSLITSKDKLEVLANCLESSYKDLYMPYTDCGVNGLGTGYRSDSITFAHTMQELDVKKPHFLFVQFKEPDAAAHALDTMGYVNGIKNGDDYAWQIWNQLQADPFYKNQTLFIVTNDHGRHLNGILDGYRGHGDDCDGCRHINLFMAGPDIHKNVIVQDTYEQIDLTQTVARIFGLPRKYTEGKTISSALNK